MKWVLPAHVYEDNLVSFLNEAARIDNAAEEIVLDFRFLIHWMPAPIVYTCALVNSWVKHGRQVSFLNHTACKAFGYLQRIDFFSKVGLHFPENFQRHASGTDFVEIVMIPQGIARLVDPVSQRLAGCLAGNGDDAHDIQRFAEFAMGEIIANVQQHANEEGFCSAQYVSKRDYARIGVADTGRGILASFRDNQSPHYRNEMSHREVLELALKPWVSSRNHIQSGQYGEPANRGVGLSMIHQMVSETYGILIVASGDTVVTYDGVRPARWNSLAVPMKGTIVSVRFSRSQIPEYAQMLQNAQQAMNLTPNPSDATFFE